MKFKLLFLIITISQTILSQTHTVSGYVEDSKTGERIIGAYVIDSIGGKTSQTNNYGYFSLKNLGQEVSIVSTYFGFLSEKKVILLQHDTVLIIKINPVTEFQEVVVESSVYKRKINAMLGLSVIPVKTLVLVPSLGEADLLKSIQNQPGIKSGVEGSSGIFVRGGGGGENLFMLDDVPLYNVSHLYGFFSAFNSSAVKDVKMLKGCFPSRYGGRTSSVIDVRSLDGNNKTIKGELSVGLISSKFMVEGPLLSDKSTFIISGRRSYLDLITEPLKKTDAVSSSFPNYYFYDLNARIAHTYSNSDKLFLSFYKGLDHIQKNNSENTLNGKLEKITERRDEISGWGNIVSSLRWNHAYDNHLFMNTTLAYSGYNYFAENNYRSETKWFDNNKSIKQSYNANYLSAIRDLMIRSDFDYAGSDKNTLRFGAGDIYHTFKPGDMLYSMNDEAIAQKSDTSYLNAKINAHELYAYLEDEFVIWTKLTLNAGVRLSSLFSDGHKMLNLEPRFSLNYMLINNIALKTGYSRMVQYLQLINSSGLSMPTDIWVPAVKGINPLKSDQINLGFAYNVDNIVYFSVEVYHKWLSQTTDLKNGASLLTDISPWYTKLEQGNGIAKGIEFYVEKQMGRLKGNISYTLSDAKRTYTQLNNGVSFPFKYNRLHDLSVFSNFQISQKWDVSALWVFGTGYPVTIASEKYMPALNIYSSVSEFGGEISYYPSRNNYNMPVYHRLDLGFHYKTTNKYGQHTFSVDIFNAYNRKNPVNMYYAGYRFKQMVSVNMLPIIPSVSYSFKF